MEKEELEKLARLARIDLPAQELQELEKDFDVILKYVSRVKEAAVIKSEDSPHESLPALRLRQAGASSPRESAIPCNVTREDEKPHESGIHSKDLLAAVPQKEGEYVKVKKIL